MHSSLVVLGQSHVLVVRAQDETPPPPPDTHVNTCKMRQKLSEVCRLVSSNVPVTILALI